MADDAASKLTQIQELTGVNDAQARFLLDMAAGDVDTAVGSFFEHGLTGGAAPPSAPRSLSHDDDDDDDDGDDDDYMDAAPPRAAAPQLPQAPVPAPAAAQPKKNNDSSSNSRIRTFNDMHNNEPSSDDEEERPEYFAGGKSSGVALQGDPKKRGLDAAQKILQMAEETGKREQSEGRGPSSSSSSSSSSSAAGQRSTFGGAGYRLGESMEEPVVPTPQSAAAASAATAARGGPRQPEEELNHTLTFWRNGFSVDDGPLRSMEDPNNIAFLQQLREGRVPAELRARFGQGVNISVRERMGEDYTPPPKVLKPFSGSGNRLGDATDPPSSAAGIAATTPGGSLAAASAPAAAAPTAAPTIALVDNEPVTSIQIRLADGTRLVARFNHTHTVGDVRTFVRQSMAGQPPFTLSTTFPTKVLTDDSLTIAQAGLINASIVQRNV